MTYIAKIDHIFIFEKGNVVIKVFHNPFYYSRIDDAIFMSFDIVKDNSIYKVVSLKVDSPQYKKFISIYFNNENLVQLLLKYSEKRKLISAMFWRVRSYKK